MAVKSIDFLNFAEDLFKSASREIEYRNVVSRSYYSSLHLINSFVLNAPKKQQDLINYLCDTKEHLNEKVDSKILRSFGLRLEQQRRNRVKADYYLHRHLSFYEAKNALKEAKICRALLEKEEDTNI